MQKSNSFNTDLHRGVEVEDFVLQRIQRKYTNAHRIDGYCKEYDIWIPEIQQGIEVKYDPMSNETGNIVIEVEMFGKPSALMTTKASYWIFYDDHVLVAITPNQIKQCIKDLNLKIVTFIGRGDTAPKISYLVKKNLLFRYGRQI